MILNVHAGTGGAVFADGGRRSVANDHPLHNTMQVVIAVHERALFEYLTLELSPAFAGDSLITVEISRNFAGDAVADPHFYTFEDDKAVAA